MTPETAELPDKARDCLARARIILAAGIGKMPGATLTWREFMQPGRHTCAHREDSPDPPGRSSLALATRTRGTAACDLALFLSQAYNLKAVADYELGPGANVPLDRASE